MFGGMGDECRDKSFSNHGDRNLPGKVCCPAQIAQDGVAPQRRPPSIRPMKRPPPTAPGQPGRMPPVTLSPERRRRNREHWSATLDPRNLRGSGDGAALKQELALSLTADVRRAIALLDPAEGRHFLALGDGLALMAIHLARRGARVTVVDIALPRLEQGRRHAEAAGVSDRITFLCASADALPLASQTFDGATTKSVLIHTDLRRTAVELRRVLRAPSRSVFIEPTIGNPLVNLYRFLAAPRIWRGITTYFRPQERHAIAQAFRAPRWSCREEHLHLLSFFATPFQFLFPNPRLYQRAESLLCAVDRGLFAMFPSLRNRCWFVLMIVEGEER